MLPTFTVEQVSDRIDRSDLMLDLSDYVKKKDAATKDDIENKLDKDEVEDIQFIKEPRVEKINIQPDSSNDSYSFYVDNSTGDLVIASNETAIATYSKSNAKWSFEDHSHTTINNDLNITGELKVDKTIRLGNLKLIAADGNSTVVQAVNGMTCCAYSTNDDTVRFASNVWVPTSKLTVGNVNITTKINDIENILKNHYQALLTLCQEHGMVDSNTSDGNKITPE